MDATNETFAAQYATYLESLAARFPGVVVNTKIEVYPDDCFGIGAFEPKGGRAVYGVACRAVCRADGRVKIGVKAGSGNQRRAVYSARYDHCMPYLAALRSAGTWYLVTGVQVFLCISGFLYGRRTVGDGVAFFRRGAWKVLRTAGFCCCWSSRSIWPLSGRAQCAGRFEPFVLDYGRFHGMEHLWFLPTILLCYLFTQLLQRFATHVREFSTVRFVAETALLCVVIQAVLDRIIGKFNAAWLFCYIVTYLAANRRAAGRTAGFRTPLIVFAVAAVVLNAARILLHSFLESPSPDSLRYYFHMLLEDYSRATFGILLFFAGYRLFSALRLERAKTVAALLRFTDRYSYDIYLTHYVWTEASFGVIAMSFTPYGDLVVILTGTVASALLLQFIGRKADAGSAGFANAGGLRRPPESGAKQVHQRDFTSCFLHAAVSDERRKARCRRRAAPRPAPAKPTQRHSRRAAGTRSPRRASKQGNAPRRSPRRSKGRRAR
jgi:surface polysaccharide O-acyltransferase-like enzyme